MGNNFFITDVRLGPLTSERLKGTQAFAEIEQIVRDIESEFAEHAEEYGDRGLDWNSLFANNLGMRLLKREDDTNGPYTIIMELEKNRRLTFQVLDQNERELLSITSDKPVSRQSIRYAWESSVALEQIGRLGDPSATEFLNQQRSTFHNTVALDLAAVVSREVQFGNATLKRLASILMVITPSQHNPFYEETKGTAFLGALGWEKEI